MAGKNNRLTELIITQLVCREGTFLRVPRDGELIICGPCRDLPSPQEKLEKSPSPIFPEGREGKGDLCTG